MDKARLSGGWDAGSSPAGGTMKILGPESAYKFSFCFRCDENLTYRIPTEHITHYVLGRECLRATLRVLLGGVCSL